jgi:hypothetical protein
MEAKLFTHNTEGLNANQKKRQRKKRTLFYRRMLGAAVEHPHEDKEEAKRPRLDPAAHDDAEASVPGVTTAEPLQHGAQLSLGSVARPPAAPPPAPATTAYQHAAPSRGACRVDMTRVALLIGSHFAGAALAASAAPAPAAGSAARPLPEAEGAASVDQRWEGEDEGEDYDEAAPSSAPPAALSGWAGAAPRPGGGGAVVLHAGGGRRVYIHGNYHRYYGYRMGQAFAEDPRLAALERAWFARRRCLDIGCNEGVVTLGIAARFGARSMVGVDIDEHLVRRACT